MSVNVSGPVLAALFYEHGNSNHDVDGLLLGKVGSHITKTISDTQIDNSTEVTNIYIYSHLVTSLFDCWYDNCGRIRAEKLKALLDSSKHQDVIGWFKFRRNSSLKLSLRERLLHANLLDCFPSMLPQNFLFFLCTPQSGSNKSTHTMDYSVLVRKGSDFEPVPLLTVNLGDTSTSEYKVTGSRTLSDTPGALSCLLSELRPEFVANDGQMHSIVQMQTLGLACNQQLQDACDKVLGSERALEILRQEVRMLRKELGLETTKPLIEEEEPVQTGDCMVHRLRSEASGLRSSNPFSPAPVIPGEESSPLSERSFVFKSFHADEPRPSSRVAEGPREDAVGDLIQLHDYDEEPRPGNSGSHDVDLMDCSEGGTVAAPFLNLQGPENTHGAPLQPVSPTHTPIAADPDPAPTTSDHFDFVDDIFKTERKATMSIPISRHPSGFTTPSPVYSDSGPSHHRQATYGRHHKQSRPSMSRTAPERFDTLSTSPYKDNSSYSDFDPHAFDDQKPYKLRPRKPNVDMYNIDSSSDGDFLTFPKSKKTTQSGSPTY